MSVNPLLELLLRELAPHPEAPPNSLHAVRVETARKAVATIRRLDREAETLRCQKNHLAIKPGESAEGFTPDEVAEIRKERREDAGTRESKAK